MLSSSTLWISKNELFSIGYYSLGYDSSRVFDVLNENYTNISTSWFALIHSRTMWCDNRKRKSGCLKAQEGDMKKFVDCSQLVLLGQFFIFQHDFLQLRILL